MIVPEWRRVDLAELMSQPPQPIPWVIDGVAARGRLTTLVGRSGIGKTWLSLVAAAAVHDGSSVGGIRCEQGATLYVDAENNSDEIRRRMEEASLGPAIMTYVESDGHDLARHEHRESLRRLIEEVKPSLVILDALKSLSPSAGESDNDAMAVVVMGVRGIARETGAAIVLQHHRSTKSGAESHRGASAIVDQSDLVMHLGGSVEALRISADSHKFRLGPRPDPRGMALREVNGRLSFIATEKPIRASKQAILREQIAEIGPHVDDGRPRRELAAIVGVPDDRTFERALRDLVTSGRWRRIGENRDSRYAPAPTG